jgi:hypothetical protein
MASARPPTKVRLQKTLKEGLRRCVYRRWEATVKGVVLITKTTELERMYRGNTPYPIGKPKVGRKPYPNRKLAEAIILQARRRRLASGYRPYTD